MIIIIIIDIYIFYQICRFSTSVPPKIFACVRLIPENHKIQTPCVLLFFLFYFLRITEFKTRTTLYNS